MKEISKEYAEALFAIACEQANEDAVMTALESVISTFGQHSEYMELVSSPGVPLAERTKLLDATFGGFVPEAVLATMGLLCERGRLRLFPSLVEEYRRLLRVRRAVVMAKVTSAVPLTKKEQAALIQQLQKKNGGCVQLVCEVDPSMMGGLIVEMDGVVTDGSLRRRLQLVKEVMSDE